MIWCVLDTVTGALKSRSAAPRTGDLKGPKQERTQCIKHGCGGAEDELRIWAA